MTQGIHTSTTALPVADVRGCKVSHVPTNPQRRCVPLPPRRPPHASIAGRASHPRALGIFPKPHRFSAVTALHGAKVLARMVGTSPDTTKKWLSASNAPTWKHTVIMLNDDELCARLLEAAGRGDLAKHQETIAALKAVIASEGK